MNDFITALLIGLFTGAGVFLIQMSQWNQAVASIRNTKSKYSHKQIVAGSICLGLAIYIYVSTR